jgi:plasmid stabilization system protein ParE
VTPIVFRFEARLDAIDAFRWYEDRSPGLGIEFRNALDSTIERIAAHPHTYVAHERGLRHAPIRRFPYSVYFKLSQEIAVVVGVIHTKRHPSVAKAR